MSLRTLLIALSLPFCWWIGFHEALNYIKTKEQCVKSGSAELWNYSCDQKCDQYSNEGELYD